MAQAEQPPTTAPAAVLVPALAPVQAPGTPTTVMTLTAGDSSLTPPPFRGSIQEDPEAWLSRFNKYVTYRGFPDREKLNLLAVLLRDAASDWYDTLAQQTRDSWEEVQRAFKDRFQASDLQRWQQASEVWTRRQAVGESVDTYVTSVQKTAKTIGLVGEQLRYALQQGLRPEILSYVIQSQPSTVEELIKAARVGEAAAKAAMSATSSATAVERMAAAVEANTMEIRQLVKQLPTTAVNFVSKSRTPSPQRSAATNYRQSTPPRRVTFDVGQREMTASHQIVSRGTNTHTTRRHHDRGRCSPNRDHQQHHQQRLTARTAEPNIHEVLSFVVQLLLTVLIAEKGVT